MGIISSASQEILPGQFCKSPYFMPKCLAWADDITIKASSASIVLSNSTLFFAEMDVTGAYVATTDTYTELASVTGSRGAIVNFIGSLGKASSDIAYTRITIDGQQYVHTHKPGIYYRMVMGHHELGFPMTSTNAPRKEGIGGYYDWGIETLTFGMMRYKQGQEVSIGNPVTVWSYGYPMLYWKNSMKIEVMNTAASTVDNSYKYSGVTYIALGDT